MTTPDTPAKSAKPSDIPFVKDVHFAYGAPDELSPLITRVIAKNPGPFTYTGSGTYLIGGATGAVAVIDPGPDLDEHIDALVETLGARPVSHILITHTHRDHCGGARKLAERVNAPIFGFGPHPSRPGQAGAPALDEGGDATFSPDQTLRDGDIIKGENWTIETIHTPGHLSNHLCFALEEDAALFTGDHIMGWATTVVAPPDGSMADYLDSLDKLLLRNDKRYYPTHGAPIDEPHRFVRAVRAHRHIRDGQIMEQLREGRTRIMDMVPIIYANVDKRLHLAAALNVLAHLIRLTETNIVTCEDTPSLESSFELVK